MSAKNRPKKPYPEFPLFAHPNRQWAKKIQGKTYYFGLWGTNEEALHDFLDRVDGIRAGRDPRKLVLAVDDTSKTTLADMFNSYLSQLDGRRDKGEVTQRYFSGMQKACKLVTEHFGRETAVSVLKAADLTSLIEALPKTWGPYKIATDVQRIPTAFKWAAESEIIDRLSNFGPNFKKPSKPVIRLANQQRQAEYGTLEFSSDEIRVLLANSAGWLTASVCSLSGSPSDFMNAWAAAGPFIQTQC